MSIEFTRGPNVYLRELVPADLENIKNSLVDWEQFPFSIDKTKNYLKGLLTTLRYIERPYTNDTQCREIFTICKNSDDSFVGFTQVSIFPGKIAEIKATASLTSLRGQGYMNEAALIRDAALFTELGCNSYTTKHDTAQIHSLRAYQTLTGTEFSSVRQKDLKLVEATLASWNTWKANNPSSIPSYTFSGGSYTPPHLRT